MILATGCNGIDKYRLAIETQEETASKEAIEIVKEVVDHQNYAINIADIDLYIKTIDSEKDEYIAERKSWFRDLVNNEISNYKINVTTAEKINDQ